jgi:hypothetical protein
VFTRNDGHVGGHGLHVQTSGLPFTPSAAQRDENCSELTPDERKVLMPSKFSQELYYYGIQILAQ